ncbi:hypothetical protein JI58_03090 [Marinosulfonomonas sp. PRT-SC04]|nr:hypothetical protein JI58_03090 [Marinosulfonomonas sp. PRT-SC04]
MLKHFCLFLVFLIPGFAASAQDRAPLEPLIEVLQLHEIFAVLQLEGVNYSGDLDREMLDNSGGEKWQQVARDIYEPNRVWQTFLPGFSAGLEGQDTAAMTVFYTSPLGQKITTLELQARRLMLDKAREQDSRAAYLALVETGDPRLTMLRNLVAANDLIEYNVMGAMNASYAFYSGMVEGGAFEPDLSQDDILQDVWAQEADIRRDTEGWVYAYLVLAYAPLSDVELQTYVEFSSTAAGRGLNAALFAGYEDVFLQVSKALGVSIAKLMQSKSL